MFQRNEIMLRLFFYHNSINVNLITEDQLKKKIPNYLEIKLFTIEKPMNQIRNDQLNYKVLLENLKNKNKNYLSKIVRRSLGKYKF